MSSNEVGLFITPAMSLACSDSNDKAQKVSIKASRNSIVIQTTECMSITQVIEYMESMEVTKEELLVLQRGILALGTAKKQLQDEKISKFLPIPDRLDC
jgi:hypothetical protein